MASAAHKDEIDGHLVVEGTRVEVDRSDHGYEYERTHEAQGGEGDEQILDGGAREVDGLGLVKRRRSLSSRLHLASLLAQDLGFIASRVLLEEKLVDTAQLKRSPFLIMPVSYQILAV